MSTTKVRGLSDHRYYEPTKRADRAKTVCTSTVLACLGIPVSSYHYSGTKHQMLAIARRKWSVRSAKTALGRPKTVAQAMLEEVIVTAQKRAIKAKRHTFDLCDVRAYVVFVPGHVLLVNRRGEVHVDTAPRTRDRREVTGIYAVRNK